MKQGLINNKLLNNNSGALKPESGLNFVLYNSAFEIVEANTSVLLVDDKINTIQTLSTDRMVMQEAGFLEIFVNNNAQTPVYFDNLMAVQSVGTAKEVNAYYPFGMIIPNLSTQALPNEMNLYKYNAKELQTDLNLQWLDYGARMYDPTIGRWWVGDPLTELGYNISLYAFAFNNPIRYIDPDGRWPGVTTIYLQGNIGGGMGYGLYAIQQSGISYDSYGKTHFTRTGTAYFVNQNLEIGSRNPNFILGADVGLSAGISQDWNSKSFVESTNKANQISTSGPTIKGSFGVGIAGNENSVSLSAGIQAGITLNTMGMRVNESVSLSDSEASKVGKMTDVKTVSWTVRNISAIQDDSGNITGYSGNVFTINTKGEYINTGIGVNSGIIDNDGNISSNNMWMSTEYQRKLNEN